MGGVHVYVVMSGNLHMVSIDAKFCDHGQGNADVTHEDTRGEEAGGAKGRLWWLPTSLCILVWVMCVLGMYLWATCMLWTTMQSTVATNRVAETSDLNNSQLFDWLDWHTCMYRSNSNVTVQSNADIRKLKILGASRS